MKKFKELMNKQWFSNALAGCITVMFFLLMSNIDTVFSGITQFLGYFSTIVLGCVLAYLMNPLAKWYKKNIFSKLKKVKLESAKWTFSVALAVATVVISLTVILLLLIPQLIESITSFVGNIGSYGASLVKFINETVVPDSEKIDAAGVKNFLASSEDIINKIVDYISDNSSKIISLSTNAGKGVVNWVVSFILSVYFLIGKDKIKGGLKKFMSVTMRSDVYSTSISFFSHCDAILNRYIIFDLIDGLIVGVLNAIFMALFGMEYIGLVSVVIGVTNLVPTFGPMVGGTIGAFIILMVKPWQAIVFIIFTLILQTCDGYIIKPKLFGNTFGVSGLLILLAIVIGGNMFGIIGILLAIPAAAILDYIYRDIFIPRLEKQRSETSIRGIARKKVFEGLGESKAEAEEMPEEKSEVSETAEEAKPETEQPVEAAETTEQKDENETK